MENIENTENEIVNTNEEQVMETETEEQTLEAAAESAEEQEQKKAAAHLAFIAAAEAHAKALGLQTADQKGYFKVWNAETGHKLYVAKQARGVTRIDTTLPPTELSGMTLPLEKPNGRITCHVAPESVTAALDKLATYNDKIPSPKKPVAKSDAPVAE